jgi:ABC transporter substrate binding protein
MTAFIGRREFITLLGGAAAAWPRMTRAQQPTGKIWRLGILQPGAPPDPLVEAIRQRLRELGYIEGRNIVFEYRWAEGKLDRLTDLARDLVGSKVDVITTLSTPAALAARNATTTIPIVSRRLVIRLEAESCLAWPARAGMQRARRCPGDGDNSAGDCRRTRKAPAVHRA